MIETFVSRPNWAPPIMEERLADFYRLIEELGFKANTIGKSQTPLRTPFEDVRRLMKRCKCTIVLGLPQIFMYSGSVKFVDINTHLYLPSEWNQIEATMSLMLELPTLVLLHKQVASRGIFDRGAANIFVHEFDVMADGWANQLRPALGSLKAAID
ncbi:MAG TPA: hypothetical protein VFX55_21495 [Duganella sp.]|nr:hypothetical protein [Duganella sp.]